MRIWSNTGGLAQTNCYLIADEQARQAVLFDAPDHTVAPLLDEVGKAGWELVGLWLTHGHFDHMADHKVVTDRFPRAKVLIHRLDEPKLQRPGVQSRMFALPFEIPARDADAYVEDGQKLALGGIEFEVIHTPGHAPGHVMYYCAKEGVLVGGDLIICGAVGRTDLPDSDHARLVESIRRVMKLPGNTKLLPGHCEITTLDEQRETNPYVRAALNGPA
jgi:hydroxyacylglutathione hydrolase